MSEDFHHMKKYDVKKIEEAHHENKINKEQVLHSELKLKGVIEETEDHKAVKRKLAE
jgi:hypothetical protein